MDGQAQGGEVVESGWYYTDTGQHVQVWRITEDDGCWCSDMKYHCATTLYTAPPSAPVGVEGIIATDEAAWALAARAEAAGAERDSDDNGTWWTLQIEQFKALAQQPAAVDGAK